MTLSGKAVIGFPLSWQTADNWTTEDVRDTAVIER